MTTRVRRTQEERSARTRALLLDAARKLLAARSFAEMPAAEIVETAGVTRGALYHHFPAGKLDLFKALFIETQEQLDTCIREAFSRAIADQIEPIAAYLTGVEVFFDALADPATARVLVTDGPAVLGQPAWLEIDAAYSIRQATDGLRVLAELGVLSTLPLDVLGQMLYAATSQMGAAITSSGDPVALRATVLDVLERILRGLAMKR